MFHKFRNETDLDDAPVPTVLPVDTVEGQQQIARLKDALLRLPEDKRELLVLSRFQQLKYEEIARILRCDVGAVKVRVHRAMQDLKAAFHRRDRTRPRSQESGG